MEEKKSDCKGKIIRRAGVYMGGFVHILTYGWLELTCWCQVAGVLFCWLGTFWTLTSLDTRIYTSLYTFSLDDTYLSSFGQTFSKAGQS